MSSDYSGDPSTDPKDAVRFLLSDTSVPWLFTNEEIQYALMTEGSPYAAAAELAFVQMAQYTNRRDKTVGPLSIRYGEISDRWAKLAANLLRRFQRNSGARAIMTQKVRAPHFTLGIHDIHQWADQNADLKGEGLLLLAQDHDIDGGVI